MNERNNDERCILQRTANALAELLQDTQHKDHDCGDEKYCPVIHAKRALAAARASLCAPHADMTDEDRAILEAVYREMDEGDGGNAPGHGHDVPGIWDSDNGALAGKPCAWCLTWAKFTKLIERDRALAAPVSPAPTMTDAIRNVLLKCITALERTQHIDEAGRLEAADAARAILSASAAPAETRVQRIELTDAQRQALTSTATHIPGAAQPQCNTEQDCTQEPWCRIKGACQKASAAQPGVMQQLETLIDDYGRYKESAGMSAAMFDKLGTIHAETEAAEARATLIAHLSAVPTKE